MIKLLCLFILAATVYSREIPRGFIKVDEDYIFSTITLEYLQAFATCKRYGKTLVTERNETETLKFNTALNNAGLSERNHWLGGIFQRGTEFAPIWIWLDYGVVLNYTNWYSTPSTSYCCIRKYPSATYSGKWSVEPCTSTYYFACKNN
ncbi:uncharacterized protein LOC143199821 [Rhynchophorus ferrugineus]|uniref:uncharacterized protein LOC143199821 n=1 Tax=Rhynchophorus ferrugineus TaxID=354439 RepID=UPI003FCE8606